MKKIIFFGASGHASACMDVALIHGYSDFAFVDPQKSNQIIHGYPILNYENIESFDNCDVFIAVGQPKIRESIYQKIGRAHV